jgi:TatD DNase family protein
MIDTHLHLSHGRFAPDRDAVIARAQAAGMTAAIEVGWDLPSSAEAKALAARHPGLLFPTAGIHPHYVVDAPADAERQLDELLASMSAAAVGETGLDFYRNLSPADVQEAFFRLHVRLARAHRLPLVIHSREATARVLEVLADEGGNPAGGVLHCFSGGPAEARRATADLDLHLGVGGTITYGDPDLAQAIAEAPAERLLLETDAPYLAPIPHRRERNEPARLQLVKERLAALRGMTPEDVDRTTTANAIRLFRLPVPTPSPAVSENA